MMRAIGWAASLAVTMLTALAPGGDAPVDGQKVDVAAALRRQVDLWEDETTGRSAGAGFDDQPFRVLMQRAGTEHVRGATPDLLHLLNNVNFGDINAECCILALGAIRDERAIVPLLGEMRWWNRAPRTLRALDALLAFRAPVCPQIVLALQSDDEIHVRRGLWALRMLAQDLVNNRLEVKLSPEEKSWFDVSDEACAAVARLCSHRSLIVRFEAGVTWLMIRPLGMAKLREALGSDTSASIRLLLDKPNELISPRASGGVRDDSVSLRAKQTRPVEPQREAYRCVSDWVPYGSNRSLRVSLTRVCLDAREPVYELNEPLWVRLEVRNDGLQPITLDVDLSSGQPCIFAALHDSSGGTATMGTPKCIIDTFRPPPTLVLDPKAVHAWEYEFLQDMRLFCNGAYTIRPKTKDCPAMLTLKVTGIPRPLWKAQYPTFGDNQKAISYPRFNVPSGPTNVYRESAKLPPPSGPIYTTIPIANVDADGNSHVYYESVPNANVIYKPAERKLIDPKFLTYVQSYHEVVTSAGGKLMRLLCHEEGALVQTISYDDQERIRLHIYHDRHGDPDRGVSVEYTAMGKIRRHIYLSGKDLHQVQSYEYQCDDEGR